MLTKNIWRKKWKIEEKHKKECLDFLNINLPAWKDESVYWNLKIDDFK